MKNIISKLCFLLVFALSVISINKINFSSSPNEEVINQIDIEYKTREEQLVSILDTFDYYNLEKNDNHLEFDSEKLVNFNSSNNYEYLSDVESGVLKQKISTNYNLEQNVFMIKISYYDKDKLVSESTKETEPVYDAEKDDAYVTVNNDRYYFSDTFDINEFEQCVAVVDDAAILVGGIIIIGVIALTLCAASSTITYNTSTQISYDVETHFENVKTKVFSFFSWFYKWIKVAVTTVTQKIVTIITKVVTPAITVNNKRIETKEISNEAIKYMEEKKYFLVFADTTNRKIYISDEIKKEIAVAILYYPIVVQCIGNSNVEMLASTYTLKKDDAYHIACLAGLHPRTPYEHPEEEYGFYHYHSIASTKIRTKEGIYKDRNPHSFFYLK